MFDLTYFSYGSGLVLAFWFVGFCISEVMGLFKNR